MNLLTWSDGTNSIIDIADKCGCPVWGLYPLVEEMVDNGILKV
jgi:aminopeptidase-like protein